MAKKKKVYEILEKIEYLQQLPQLSFHTQTTFGAMGMFGGQVSFGIDNDYKTLDQVRDALTELVDEFGGKVDWNE